MKLQQHQSFYEIFHKGFACDSYETKRTIVEAGSAQEAMDKLNSFLQTKPDGIYTDFECENINNVRPLSYLTDKL